MGRSFPLTIPQEGCSVESDAVDKPSVHSCNTNCQDDHYVTKCHHMIVNEVDITSEHMLTYLRESGTSVGIDMMLRLGCPFLSKLSNVPYSSDLQNMTSMNTQP
jgi:hypothetical protein